MGDYKSFIIHLQRSTERKPQVQDLLRKSPFDAEIVDAVDGATLSKDDIAAIYSSTPLMKPAYPFGMNAGEIGCFQSHRRVWQKIVDQNLTAGLVFEDDVHIVPEIFEPALEVAINRSADFGFVQFQVREVAQDSPEMAHSESFRILRPVPTLLRCSAQLISQSTAKQLLQATTQFDRPVDTLLQIHWITGVHPVCIVPSGVSDRTKETGGSTLSKKRPLKSKFAREWKRFHYRRKIAHLSARPDPQ